MIISLARMPDDGLRFEHQYGPEELDLSDHEFAFREPPRVAGRVDRVGLEMRLRGKLGALIEAPCDRCLREVQIPIEREFDLLYSPEDPGAGLTGEAEVHGRDLDIALYENDEIDLDQLVHEQLELSLPTRVLCREDCRGLCASCGADLNLEQCHCTKPMDPRWQALADLKERS
jgi:uncharacterized protein